jgi:predicted permease
VNPIDLPPGETIELSLPVLAFTAFLAVLTSLIFGFVPAWKASRIDLNETLKAGGRGASPDRRRHWLSKGLVALEVMLSLVLLVGAGLLIQSVSRLSAVPLGFSTDRLLTMFMSMPRSAYAKAETRVHFYDQVLGSMESLPEVQAAAISTTPPLQGSQGSSVLLVSGRPEPAPSAAIHEIGQVGITPNYFKTLGIPLAEGRPFESRDQAGSEQVAIVNEALARKYFNREDTMGQKIRFLGEPDATNPWLSIVGVAANEKRSSLAEMSWLDAPTVYRPIAQRPPGGAQLILRTASDQARIGAAVQQRLAAIDANVPITNVDTVQHMVSKRLAYPRFRAVLFGTFAALALLLAVVGLYGVLSQLVAQRTHEIGVRMALGAREGDVLRMVVREGLALSMMGVLLGLVATWWLTKFLTALLYGIGSMDPATLAAGSVILIAAGFLATYLPARSAARVDPNVALRYE